VPRVSLAFHPAAAAEYTRAFRWYDERGATLGTSFVEEISRALRLIRETPDRWPRYGTRHRRILVRRFPYSVVYLSTATRIWIVAVEHARRRPGYWRSRHVPG
jgi:toxin ParE1/3/4